jgi:acetylornithine deacetylase/succinyl-diaminopimelate desuccinylase-like protein
VAAIDLTGVDQHIERDVERSMEELSVLCAMRSVSVEATGLRECAEHVRGALAKRGFKAEVLETSGFPAVYGESGEGSHALLLYNHYDVQPVEPVEAWTSPPFSPQIRDGKLFARGATDDKGEIVARLAALDALRAVGGGLPCRVKFLIEGEEEIGSPNLEPFIARHAERLAADGCIWEAGGIDVMGRPVVALGMRGLLYVELRVRALDHDAHSGYAHVVPSAAWRLVRALQTLKDSDERVTIAGFYDDVRPPTAAQRRFLENLGVDWNVFAAAYGTASLLGSSGAERATAVFNPTCNIAGLTSGHQGPGGKTIIPAQASCKIDFRLVPEQDPDDIARKLRRHLDAHGFDDIAIEVDSAQRAGVSDPDSPIARAAIDAAREVYGGEPAVHPIVGGTGPIDPFLRHLHVPVASIGCGYPGCRQHAPDEHLLIDNWIKGTKMIARTIARFAQGV